FRKASPYSGVDSFFGVISPGCLKISKPVGHCIPQLHIFVGQSPHGLHLQARVLIFFCNRSMLLNSLLSTGCPASSRQYSITASEEFFLFFRVSSFLSS